MRAAYGSKAIGRMGLRVGAGTDVGRLRSMNEDAYMSRTEQGLFVVCDGMGGGPAGEVASRMAIDAIARELDAVAGEESLAASRAYLPHTARLADAVRQSNAVIYDQAQKNPSQTGMGTTVVGAWIRQHIASVAHVGDSRAYLWHDERLEPLTRDHSLAEALLSSGEEPRMPFENQNALVRVLGREPRVDVDIREVPVQTGDYVVLCSDGLTRMVPEAELERAILRFQEPQRICDHLIEAANRNGGADNITVVVVEVTGNWWHRMLDWWKRSVRRGDDVETYAAV